MTNPVNLLYPDNRDRLHAVMPLVCDDVVNPIGMQARATRSRLILNDGFKYGLEYANIPRKLAARYGTRAESWAAFHAGFHLAHMCRALELSRTNADMKAHARDVAMDKQNDIAMYGEES